jgi:hypothetical protein
MLHMLVETPNTSACPFLVPGSKALAIHILYILLKNNNFTIMQLILIRCIFNFNEMNFLILMRCVFFQLCKYYICHEWNYPS